jgi:phosphate transport system substrate-binding protein
MTFKTSILPVVLSATTALALAACNGGGDSPPIIAVDGSSTVFPISEAVAEGFQGDNAARVTVGVSGTGGGFQKFCAGEIVITGASRPIKPSEVEACAEGGIEYIELPVAYDGIAVVIHPENTWATEMTVEELAALWRPEAQETVTNWSHIRTGWPDEEIHLFAPGVDSGTYDYFTKAIVGTEHASRGDITSSEDDNVLVQGVAGDRLALGFFGFAYYSENADSLTAVAVIDGDETNGAGGIQPSVITVADGTYQPLSRPIFVYVSTDAAEREEVQGLINYYLTEGRELVNEVGYIAMPDRAYELALERFAARTTGSVFGGDGSTVGASVIDMLEGQ